MTTTTTQTTETTAQAAETGETDQRLAQLRRQRDGLAIVIAVACAISLGITVLVAPRLADPAAVTIAGTVTAIAGVRYLLRHW